MDFRFELILSNELFKKSLCKINIAEKKRIFCRHDIEHLIDTARIGYILILENKLNISKDIIYAAALLHDIGRSEEYHSGTPHDKASAEIAQIILSECGYTSDEQKHITTAILQHRTSSDSYELSTLGGILYRADKLSRVCCTCSSYNECNWDNDKKNFTLKY